MEQQDLLSSYRKDLKERILVTSMRAFIVTTKWFWN